MSFFPDWIGNGFYYQTLRDLLGQEHDCSIIEYPATPLGFEELCCWVCGKLDGPDYILVAESFGGPVAVRIAEMAGEHARGLVLCSTFLKSPLPGGLLRMLVGLYPAILRYDRVAKHSINVFMYNGRNLPLARQVYGVLKATPEETMLSRIHQLARLDVTGFAARLRIPIITIRANQDRLIWQNHLEALYPVSALRLDGPHNLARCKPQEIAGIISGFIGDFVKH